MEGVGLAFVALIVLVVIGFSLYRQRQRAANVDLEDKSWLRASTPEVASTIRTAPVRDFHVHGHEARVSFDVPLPDVQDPVLNDLLVDEAVEVVREKRHTLPISDVTEIVVFAGRDDVQEIGRTPLPSPGQLPPPMDSDVLSLTHVARDPFASQFEVDHSVRYDTAVRVPSDELGPLPRRAQSATRPGSRIAGPWGRSRCRQRPRVRPRPSRVVRVQGDSTG